MEIKFSKLDHLNSIWIWKTRMNLQISMNTNLVQYFCDVLDSNQRVIDLFFTGGILKDIDV